MVDNIPTYKNVIFAGEYFTLMSTVEVLDDVRMEGESDDELAIRSASAWLKHHYGWDMEEHATAAGIVEDSGDPGSPTD